MAPGDPVAISFRGFASKKNRKAPTANGRGIFIEPKTRAAIERMELQVPHWARDLKLENPEVEWYIRYTNGHVDVDGIITTVLDILQKYGVIVNDNITHFGNRQTIHPAERADEDEITVILIPSFMPSSQPAPRYSVVRKVRSMHRMPMEPTPIRRSGLDFLEDYVPEEE